MWVSNHQIVTALICIKSYMNERSICSNFCHSDSQSSVFHIFWSYYIWIYVIHNLPTLVVPLFFFSHTGYLHWENTDQSIWILISFLFFLEHHIQVVTHFFTFTIHFNVNMSYEQFLFHFIFKYIYCIHFGLDEHALY